MPKYQITSPDGQSYEVDAPEGATEQDAIAYVQSNMQQSGAETNPTSRAYAPQEGEIKQDSQNLFAGVGKGMVDLARGAGQIVRDGIELVSPQSKGLGDDITGGKGTSFADTLGLPTEADIARSRELDAPLMETGGGQIGNFIGQTALSAPAMFIPGVNTYAGATAFGAGVGALQPTVEGESRALNTGLGATGGVVGQKLGSIIGNLVKKRVASNLTSKSQNATRDATLSAAKDVGYKVPRSLYNPTFLSNRLESFGGKAATLQGASAKNQEVTNSLARKALGVSDDTPLSVGSIEKVRQQAYKPYQEVAAISKGAKNTLEELKQARSDANAWFASYNRTANPEHLGKAKDFQEIADVAESVLEDYAKNANKPELVSQLADARKTIAKSYTVERAINKGTGDVDARVLGRLYDKKKPLSDGLDEIGRFSTSFPKAAQPIQQSSGAGISALDAALATAMGAGGAYGTESPKGAVLGVLPLLLRPATRGLALSKLMQKTPSYGGKTLSLTNKAAPVLPYLGMGIGGNVGATSN